MPESLDRELGIYDQVAQPNEEPVTQVVLNGTRYVTISTSSINWDRIAPAPPVVDVPLPELETYDYFPTTAAHGDLIYRSDGDATYRATFYEWTTRPDWQYVCSGNIRERFPAAGSRFPHNPPNGFVFWHTRNHCAYVHQWGNWEWFSDDINDAGLVIDEGPAPEPEPDEPDYSDPDGREPEHYTAVPASIEDAVEPEAHRGCVCEACKFRKFGTSSLGHALIDSAYSTPPGGWTPRGVGNYFFGVELETSWVEGSGVSVPPNIAADMARPVGFWYPKSDASVSGPEFASYPATPDMWRSYHDDLDEMFRMLLHAGYRSHDGGTAGMHISFSRSAITNTRHLYRLLSLIHRNEDFSVTLSQRSHSRVSEWAKLDTYASRESREDYVAQVMPDEEKKRGRKCRINEGRNGQLTSYDREAGYRWCSAHNAYRQPSNSVCDQAFFGGSRQSSRWVSDRYVALNAPSPDHDPDSSRFEFRLPRGTLRLDRFYKNLEWVEAMIEFTRESKNTNSIVFARYVERHSEMFPNLLAFMEEKNLMPTRKVKVAA